MSRFTDRVVLVTGAGGSLGRGISRRLADEGATLVLADVDADALATAAEALGTPVVQVDADLSTPAGAQESVAAALATHGRLDVLVNNAGGGVIRPTLRHTEDTLRATVDRNLWTTVYCTLAALPGMVERRYGRIVNIGAESVRNGLVDHAIYNAAKGGVHALASGLAREFAPHGITVNVVAPCIVETDEVRAARANPELARLVEAIVDTVPLGRPATVAEVAVAVANLAAEESGFVTGQVISVNGGSSMQ